MFVSRPLSVTTASLFFALGFSHRQSFAFSGIRCFTGDTWGGGGGGGREGRWERLFSLSLIELDRGRVTERNVA